MEKKKENFYRIPFFIALTVFCTCVSIIYVTDKENMNASIYLVSGIYSFICLSFLLFQLYAFVKAHTDYDEDVEDIKYAVFEAEKDVE
ncbi:MAG: hypothetical protein ACPGJV_01135 [Bacteriovoracaceae bacterium]